MLPYYHVGVVQRPVNLDLTHELLPSTRLAQRSLRNHFGCTDLVRFQVEELVHLGEAAFAEKAAFRVLLEADVAVGHHDLFFNHRTFAAFVSRLPSRKTHLCAELDQLHGNNPPRLAKSLR